MKINLHVVFILTLLAFLLKFVFFSAYTYHSLRDLKIQKDWNLINDVAYIQMALFNADQLPSSSSQFDQDLKTFQGVSPLKNSSSDLQVTVLEKKPALLDQGAFFVEDPWMTKSQNYQLLNALKKNRSVKFTAFFKNHRKYVTYVLQDAIDLRGLIYSLEVSLGLIFLLLVWWWVFVYYEKKFPLRVFEALTSETPGENADSAIQTLKRKIERYYQEKNLMLTALSHDIKTPLTEALLTLDLADSPEFSEVAASLRKNLEQIHSVVRTSLDYAKDEKHLNKQELELVSFFQKIVASYRDHGLSVSLESHFPAIRGKVEPSLMQRLLMNLIDNALKYASKVQVLLKHDNAKKQLMIEVQDNGPGVSEKSLSLLGSPYYREDQSRSRGTGGVGLGLAIVKKIAELHGGKVDFRNRPAKLGGGLCVCVYVNLNF